MNMSFFYIAVFFMCLIILNEYVKSKYHINTENINLKDLLKKNPLKNKISASKSKTVTPEIKRSPFLINKKTGDKSLIMMDSGINKATVMATLRQITGLDYNTAKQIVYSAPMTFMINLSEKEAGLTKQALEFVGAKIEIK